MKKSILLALACAGLGTVGLVTPEAGVGMSVAKAETVSASTENNKPVRNENAQSGRIRTGSDIKISRRYGSGFGNFIPSYSPLYDMARIERAKRNQFRNRKR